MTGIVNGDATVGTGISIKEFIVTTFKLAVGLFPLNYRQDSIKNLLFKSFDFSMLNCARWIIIFCMIFAISRLMISAKKISVRKYIRMSFFCFIGMILPGMLVAVTNKFVDMIYKIGIKSFGVSYYSYFFIIAWIAMSVVFVFQRIPIKKIFITIVMIVFAFITEFTFINNEYYIEVLSSQNDKYNLWCGVIETDYFKNLEEGAQIYLPEYIGIHYDINTLANYANNMCGTNITTTNDFDTLNFEKPVFYLNLDNNNKAVYLARIDKEFVSDEVFVYSNEKLDGFGIIADRLSGANESELYLNGRFRNVYSSNIVTDSLNISSNEFLINCNDIKTNTFEIYKPSSNYDNGLISFRNIYEEESWGRWAESECSIIYENRNDNLESAKIYLSLSTPGKDASEIIVSCGNYKESITTSGMSSIVLEFPINVGKNELNISSSAPDIVVEGDLRKMNIQIYNIVLVVGNNEYKVCCP